MTERSAQQKKHQSTPPLKASWFEDDHLEPQNAMKEPQTATAQKQYAVDTLTVRDFFDLFSPDDGPASG